MGGGSEVLSVVAKVLVVLICGHGAYLAVIWPDTASRESAKAADVPEAGGGVGSLHRPGS